MELFISTLEQGLIFSIVALGIYLTFKVLKFSDLSVDGTFPLGAAITALCLMKGMNPFISCIIAFFTGALAGLVTGVLNVKLKISELLSGILVMMGLYSINLRIMSKSNVPLFGKETIFSKTDYSIIILLIIVLVIKLALDLFMKTKLGFILTATGDNEQMVTLLGVNKDSIKLLGLMLSNGFIAFSGAIMAQYQGFSDVNMGTGTMVMGLAAVVMGETIFKKVSIIKATTMTIIGSMLYKAAISIALKMGLPATDLKLITALIVILALSLNGKSFGFKNKKLVTLGGKAIAKNTKSIQDI